MNKIRIEIDGVAAEIVLGNYMPTDTTIMNNWEDFYRYNDLIHKTLLLKDYISTFRVFINEQEIETVAQRKIKYEHAKTIVPFMVQDALYLRTECVEDAHFVCEFETEEEFDLSHLTANIQDYDSLFKVGNAFVEELQYKGSKINLEWQGGKPLGNICLLCGYQNGYLVPMYDAIKKVKNGKG